MADDTKGHTTGETGPGPAPEDHPATFSGVAASTVGQHPTTTAAGGTEWTASDSRGPLNEAPPLVHGEESAETPHVDDHAPDPVTQAPLASEGPPASEADTLVPPPMHTATAAAAVKPRRSLLPVAAGVVIGAIIGAGSAYFIYDLQSGANSGFEQKIAQLSGRVDTLEQRPDPQAAITGLKASLADLGGKVASLQTAPSAGPQVAAAAPQSSPPSSTPPGPASGAATSKPASAATAPGVAAQPATTSAPAFDPAPLQQKIAALQASLADLQKQQADASKGLEGKVGDLKSTVEGLKAQGAEVKTLQAGLAGATAAIAGVQKQATGAQTGIEAIQGQQKSFEGRISAPALAVVADSLVQQIDQGQPYAQQVDALVTLGADPARIAILRENARKGVPSAKALGVQFAPLVEPILSTEHKVAANAGLFDRLKSGMSGMVNIRNTGDTTGNDLGSQVSRIEADLTHDDVAGAYTTWTALPADAKAKSDAWGALAKTAAEAIDAARALQQGAIASLGGRKS